MSIPQLEDYKLRDDSRVTIGIAVLRLTIVLVMPVWCGFLGSFVAAAFVAAVGEKEYGEVWLMTFVVCATLLLVASVALTVWYCRAKR